jgi:hypothetical protein
MKSYPADSLSNCLSCLIVGFADTVVVVRMIVFNKPEVNNSVKNRNFQNLLKIIYFIIPDENRCFKCDNNIIATIKTNLKNKIR